ncbi:hypothetical protein [Variovorax ginsengisoli]|uniref:Molybdopterin molybdenumtransferase MoeA n=1 Tax=Variovorax ginsengisoli TaxID=363844 RepID=A0ABT8SFR5_9BURK|nr:hypothetical protein [Variovorax ginsengisoli]MDN8617847.1 hypothetical protein [Variovorax ginsengisoli]MDO1537017.1 hypothetical protein [Variovorax ginsengisoli]
MTPISIADLAGAVLERLPRSDAAPDLPCTTAHPVTGAAVVLDARTSEAQIRPILAVDFYEGRP